MTSDPKKNGEAPRDDVDRSAKQATTVAEAGQRPPGDAAASERAAAAPSQPAAAKAQGDKGSKPAGVVTSTGHAARMLAAAPDEQITAALAAGKHERAADLMQRHGERLLAEGAEEGLVRWFEQLPNALIQKMPRLAVLHAWLLVYREQYPGAATRISEAERALRALEMSGAKRWPEDGDDVVPLSPFADVKRSIRALRSHLAWIHGELDVSELPASVDDMMLPSSAEHPVWRARALVTLARCRFLAGALADAAQDLDAAIACTTVTAQRAARSVGLEAKVGLGRVREAQARLDDAAKLYAEVIDEADDSPDVADAVAAARVGQGRVALAHRDLDAAAEALAAGLVRADETGWLSVAVDGLVALAWVQHARGDHADARASLERADRFVKSRDRRWAAETVALQRVTLMLAHDDRPGIRRWRQSVAVRGPDRHERLGPIREARHIVEALVGTALGDADQVIEALVAARASAEEAGRTALAVEAAIAEARCRLALDARAEAAAALGHAVKLAAPSSLVHPFLLLGPLPDALVAALPAPSNDAERALVAAIGATVDHAPPTKRQAPPTGKKRKEGRPSGPIETARPVADAAPSPHESEPEEGAPSTAEEAVTEEAAPPARPAR